MTGDRHAHDGGTAALGTTTLLLPPLCTETEHRPHLAEALAYRHSDPIWTTPSARRHLRRTLDQRLKCTNRRPKFLESFSTRW